MSVFAPRRHAECQKVSAEAVRRTGRWIDLEEEAAEFLARAQHFAAPMARPARIGRCVVEERESPAERVVETLGVVGVVCSDRSLNLAADVGELLDEREPLP